MSTTLYALRHVATGTLMPEMKNRKGYSHWSPGQPGGIPDVALQLPRLFHSAAAASLARGQWARGRIELQAASCDPFDPPEYLPVAKDCGRTTDDLVVVEFDLVERTQ